MSQEQLRIDYDKDAMDIMDAVNERLEQYGLMFEDDGLAHDGFLLYDLKRLDLRDYAIEQEQP